MKKSIKDIKGVELTAKQMKDLKGGDNGYCTSYHCTAFTGSNGGTQSGHCKVPAFANKCKCDIGGVPYESANCSGISGGGGGPADSGGHDYHPLPDGPYIV
jgi:hypothetical protein